MSSLSRSKESEHKDAKHSPEHDDSQDRTFIEDEYSPPRYYDSEPSSQPPRYGKDSMKSPPQRQSVHRPTQSTAGASAASVAAVLAAPSYDYKKKDKTKKPWRERYRDWRASWDTEYVPNSESRANLNVFGYRIDGRQNMQKAPTRR